MYPLKRMRAAVMLTGLVLVAAACGAKPASTPELGPHDGTGLPPVEPERVAVGDVAPDFSLRAYDGGVVTLSDYRGRRDVLLVFYRGHW